MLFRSQRKIARKLGWLPKLEPGEMATMTNTEFVARFRAKGATSVTDMWKEAQHYCEFLRRTGRLELVARKLGFGYISEWHPNDLEYFLERCRRVGDLTVWCQLDKNAAVAARKFGLMPAIRAAAPRRPAQGYPSAGGFCRSMPELAVARLLEANKIEFVTQMAYPFTFPRGYAHPCRGDFYLTRFGAYVEVWSAPSDDLAPFWESYLVRRRFKTELCGKLNLRLLDIEGQLLFHHGTDVYISHIIAVLQQAGLKITTGLDPWSALLPEMATKKVSNRGRAAL